MALVVLTCPDSPLVGIKAYGLGCADPAMGDGKSPHAPRYNIQDPQPLPILQYEASVSEGKDQTDDNTTNLVTLKHLLWGGPNSTERCLTENKLFLQHETKATAFPILLPILSPSYMPPGCILC